MIQLMLHKKMNVQKFCEKRLSTLLNCYQPLCFFYKRSSVLIICQNSQSKLVNIDDSAKIG